MLTKVWTLQKNKKMFNDIKRWFKSRIKGFGEISALENYTENQKISLKIKLKIVVFLRLQKMSMLRMKIYKSYFKKSGRLHTIKAAANVIKKIKKSYINYKTTS